MSYVEINKVGIFRCHERGKEIIKKRAKKSTIWARLNERCVLGENTTLFDIFNAVDQYPRLKSFIAQFSACYWINEFHNTAHEDREPEDGVPLDFLEISRYIEIADYKEKRYFNSEIEFSGVGQPEKEHPGYIEKDGLVRYSVSYSPMNKLAHLPVELDEEVKIYQQRLTSESKFPVDKPIKIYFTLLEVLNAIYWDISFVGGPEDNKKFLEQMKETVEGIKNGTIETEPFDLEQYLEDDEGE